ncbi:Hypothetical protein A7982_01068 [Minicystis rosea]|nr:Hypothetical protein A7982_01068 [Minicystis rosea]
MLLGLLFATPRCGDVVVSQGLCAKTCATAADCCSPGAEGCPGAYPQNFACEKGLCRAPVCEQDSDCEITGLKLGCRAVDGKVGCVVLCEKDADCSSSSPSVLGSLGTCIGTSDDGAKICKAELPPCTSDADCLGNNRCVDGICGCATDADCPAQRHCQSGRCGCASDAECGPNLDACTTDPAFAYPPSASSTSGSH